MFERADSPARMPSSSQGGSHVFLSSFFEDAYRPLQLRHRSAAYADIFRNAIRWLAQAMGRKPLVADLTRENFDRLTHHLVAAGLGRARTIEVRKRINALWRYAAALGLAGAYEPTALPPTVAPNWRTQPAGAGTLLDHYRRNVRPRIIGFVRRDTLSTYDSAVNRLHDFCGKVLTLAEVDAALLERFEAGMRLNGYRESAARYVALLKKILRTVDAARFPKRPNINRCYAPKGCSLGRPSLPEPDGEPGTIAHFYRHTFLSQGLAHAGRRHRQTYNTLLRKLLACFGRELRLNELSATVLADYAKWQQADGRDCRDSLTTVKRDRTMLLALWRYAHDLGEAPEPPRRIPRLRIPRQAPDAWSLDELGRIVAAASELHSPEIAGHPAGRIWRAMLLVGWYTGLRRGSLLKLRPQDVNLEERWIEVPAGAMKNFVGQRFRFGEDAAAALREIWNPDRPTLFPMTTDNVKKFGSILKAAGVPKSRLPNGQFHKLRRTTATHVAAAAGLAAASALLGHSTADLLKRYIDPRYIVGNDATEFLPSLTPPAGG